MMQFTKTENKQLIEGLTGWEYNEKHLYLLSTIEGEAFGIYEIQPLTKITGNVHVIINPEYRGTRVSFEMYQLLKDYLRDHTEYRKLIATVPEKNERMLRVINRTEFRACGLIQNGIIWDGQEQNLIVFELDIKR